MFNTLKYAKMMEEVGFSRQQAETSVRILVEVIEDKLATKQDLKELESRLEHRFAMIDSRFEILESKLTVRMGAMLAASIAILTAIQKLT